MYLLNIVYYGWYLWKHWRLQQKRKRKVLIVFDDMISHVMSDKKAQQVLKEPFIRCRKLNISLFFNPVLF